METRNPSEGHRKRVEVEEAIVEPKAPSTVRLVLLQDVRLRIKGPITGNEYYFDRAGSEFDVDYDDAYGVPGTLGMLEKQTGKACCGGSKPSKYFKTVE